MIQSIPDSLFEQAIKFILSEKDRIEAAIDAAKAKDLEDDFELPIRFAGATIFRLGYTDRLRKRNCIKKFAADKQPILKISLADGIIPLAWSNSLPEKFRELACELGNMAIEAKDALKAKELELALILAWQEINKQLA